MKLLKSCSDPGAMGKKVERDRGKRVCRELGGEGTVKKGMVVNGNAMKRHSGRSRDRDRDWLERRRILVLHDLGTRDG